MRHDVDPARDHGREPVPRVGELGVERGPAPLARALAHLVGGEEERRAGVAHRAPALFLVRHTDDRVVHALPLYHVHGLLLGTLGPLWRGGSSHHVGRFDPHALGDALREMQHTEESMLGSTSSDVANARAKLDSAKAQLLQAQATLDRTQSDSRVGLSQRMCFSSNDDAPDSNVNAGRLMLSGVNVSQYPPSKMTTRCGLDSS